MDTRQLKHGGNLIFELNARGIRCDNYESWLDLSTGVSPFSYPIPKISEKAWRELPQIDDEFYQIVSKYYGSNDFLVTAGSQAIIKLLPELIISRKAQHRVFIPRVGYKEHLKAWQRHEVKIESYHKLPDLESLEKNDVLVVINPNNPTGEFYSKQLLFEYADRLESLNGLLVVDEAFIEARNRNESVIQKTMSKSLVVFRSIGKFFGLAGVRAGFVFAQPVLLEKVALEFGPWTVNGPALELLKSALSDKQWQIEQFNRINSTCLKLEWLLKEYFPTNRLAASALFITLHLENAKEIFEALLDQRVYVRLCDEGDSLRFGLPDGDGLNKLKLALEAII